MKKNGVLAAAIFVFALIVIMGATQVENWSTDNYSDRAIYNEMLVLADGGSKYGIVGVTHYPNGPGYFLVPFIKLGIKDYSTLRWFPYFISVLSIGFLLWTLIRLPLADRTKLSALVLMLFPVMLPGFVYWQGALHEHSYAMSLCLITLAIAVRPLSTRCRQLTALTAIGFIAGWIGYDFLPVHGLSFAVMALAAGIYLTADRWRDIVTRTFTQSFALASGMILAIATHIWQNTLYFGSFDTAWNDLIGSAAARAGVDQIAQQMSPEYAGTIASSIETLGHKTDPLSTLGLLFRSFILDWSSYAWVVAFSIAILAVVFFARREFRRLQNRQRFTCAALLLSAILAGTAWTVLMPKHAVIHMHFVPRHLLVAFISAILILAIALNSFGTAKKEVHPSSN